MKIRGKTVFVYDIEVFPNFFSITVKNTESGNHRFLQISEKRNDMPDIAKLFLNKNIWFVGYNSKHYDSPVISYILINYNDLIIKPVWEITRDLKKFSDLVINSATSASWSKYKYANLFKDLDLLTMMFAQKLRVGLKSLQVTMEYDNVEEYDGDFNRPLPEEDFEKLESYNLNDVLSTEQLLYRISGEIDLRLGIQDTLGVDVLNMDGVNLGVEVIKTNYLKETGKNWKDIKDLRSPCNEIDLKDIIFDFINFKRPELKSLLKTLQETHINLAEEKLKKQKDRWKQTVFLDDLEITYSLGGVHTKNKPAIYKSDNQWIIIDSDCASMYPSAIINYGLYPRHLGPEFLTTYKKIKADRLKAKREGNKIMNQTYKLALNGISGMLQSEYSWCYDPKTVITLRLNCQLMLLMLTERLLECGCQIGQLNTDGILYLADTQRVNEVMEVCKEWEKITQFELEHEYFEAFYQYAVNDYIGVYKGYSETKNPKLIKTKGLFIREPILGKGLAPQIIAETLVQYFVNNVPVNETLMGCKDIKKFLTFQKVKKEFSVEHCGKIVRHINRYYMSTNGCKIRKCKIDPLTQRRYDYEDICATSGVTLFNKLEDIDLKDAKINYNWYRNEIYKTINAIEDSLNPTLF